MADDADGPRRIWPVAYQETDSRFRIVSDATGMGKALIEQCDLADIDYLRAARSCIAFTEGKATPEQARADFIRAMTAAGVFVREGEKAEHPQVFRPGVWWIGRAMSLSGGAAL